MTARRAEAEEMRRIDGPTSGNRHPPCPPHPTPSVSPRVGVGLDLQAIRAGFLSCLLYRTQFNHQGVQIMTTTHEPNLDRMPGAPIESRPLQLVILADCSSSMAGEKIASLNAAIVEAIDALKASARDNPTARIEMRVISFSSAAMWVQPTPTPIETYTWTNLVTSGSTDMAGAVDLLVDAVQVGRMPARGLPPVYVLITDGMPDDHGAYDRAVDRLLASPWGKKGVRVGIGIGTDVQEKTLERFIANPEMPVLNARNASELANRIRWATVALTQAVSMPQSQAGPLAGNVAIPKPPPAPQSVAVGNVW